MNGIKMTIENPFRIGLAKPVNKLLLFETANCGHSLVRFVRCDT